MIELIKKSMLAGLGAAAITKDTVENQLSQWVEQGKVSATEAQNMATQIVDQGKSSLETVRAEASKFIAEILTKADFARQSDLDALVKRVNALEGSVTQKNPAKKTPKS